MQALSIKVQRCGTCGKSWHTKLPACPFCASANVGPTDVDGAGAVYSWVEICRSLETPPRPVPYTIVAVDLDSGARVFGRYNERAAPMAGARVRCDAIDHDHLDGLSFKQETA